jgi:Tfp pilus assembly protein PilF
LQDAVAGDIVFFLMIRRPPRSTHEASTRNQPAYDEYLRGRFDWNQRTYASLESAAGHFQNAIKLDPDFALGYAGLADTYLILVGNLSLTNRDEMERRASEAIARALALAPDLAEGHASLGFLEQSRWNLGVADVEFRRAIAINPNIVTARHWLANSYRARGDHVNARRELQDARRLDPLSPILWTVSAMNSLDSGDENAAAAEVAEALAIAPDFSLAELVAGQIALVKGDPAKAEALFRKGAQKPVVAYSGEAALANLYGRTGRIPAALAIIERLRHVQGKQYVSPMIFCVALAGVGKNAEAVDWLKRGIEQKDTITFLYFRGRMLGDLTKDPRYQAVIRRVDAELSQQGHL